MRLQAAKRGQRARREVAGRRRRGEGAQALFGSMTAEDEEESSEEEEEYEDGFEEEELDPAGE